ncbi:hypothetical protein [Prauserella marina]|uniref:hypothetical protein n=1 Tax=Prauserella marina TaxID=530584 RepID=UPI00115FDF88|nr:hypothetical protein [Prauserella marina]
MNALQILLPLDGIYSRGELPEQAKAGQLIQDSGWFSDIGSDNDVDVLVALSAGRGNSVISTEGSFERRLARFSRKIIKSEIHPASEGHACAGSPEIPGHFGMFRLCTNLLFGSGWWNGRWLPLAAIGWLVTLVSEVVAGEGFDSPLLVTVSR